MSHKFALLILLPAMFVSCQPLGDKQERPACATQACTKEFRTISMKFLDKDGNQIAVDNYTATNMRTHVLLHDNSILVPGVNPPYYNVANDNDLAKLSDDGDNIEVSGTDPTTSQTKTAIVKVSGGCNCHVEKASGPEQIQFK